MCVGKSSLLSVLGRREVPIPEHIDIFHLTREMPASDKTALKCVMEVDEERVKLERLAESLAHCEDDGEFVNTDFRSCSQYALVLRLVRFIPGA